MIVIKIMLTREPVFNFMITEAVMHIRGIIKTPFKEFQKTQFFNNSILLKVITLKFLVINQTGKTVLKSSWTLVTKNKSS